jgi:hypothetical protein
VSGWEEEGGKGGAKVEGGGGEGEGRRRGLTAIMMSVVMDKASLSLEDPTTLQPRGPLHEKRDPKKRVCGDIYRFVR